MTTDGTNPLAGTRLAFIGAGVMAESMIAGILKQGQAAPNQIVASHPRFERREKLEQNDEAWLRYYCGNLFWYDFTDQQKEMIAAIRNTGRQRGNQMSTAQPISKTTQATVHKSVTSG